MHEGHAFDDRPRHLPDVVAGRWLDLDDVRTEIGERRRDGGGTEHRALDDAPAVERPAAHGITRHANAPMPGRRRKTSTRSMTGTRLRDGSRGDPSARAPG